MDKVRILQCLSEEIEVDLNKLLAFPVNSDLTELGMSSLNLVSFIVRLESEFDIEVRDSDLLYDKFSTIDCIFATLTKYFFEDSIKKVLVLDADNVLWKGVSGEEKIEIDEEVYSFHKQLLSLYKKGVLLCVCSKNEEDNITKAFQNEKMIIAKENFVSIIANFKDKASNILELSDNLNLSIDSFVFVDDDKYELGYVTKALPEIVGILLSYKNINTILQELFQSIKNDTTPNRTILYKEQIERQKARKPILSIDEYNRSIGTKTSCFVAKQENAERLTELSKRTHQFNLSDRQYELSEMKSLIEAKEYTVFALTAEDVYGDMGIVGMAVVCGKTIETFIISCRVFERNFEEIMLNKITQEIPGLLQGVYKDNGKNSRFANFYQIHNIETI